MDWARLAGVDVMLAVNLGTRGLESALDLIEYANLPSGTALSDLRAANGHPEPHAVRFWCLGNEVDGYWQTGHKSADDYGKLAAQVAYAMKHVDGSIQVAAAGSSSRMIPTFGEWERVVLHHTYEFEVRPVGVDEWMPSGTPLVEDVYTVLDVVVGGMLITLLRHADRVRSASLAQLVNVLAPIMTEPGGGAWRQTTFHPFALTSRLARGIALRTLVTAPDTPTARFGDVPALDAVATFDPGLDRTCVFVINRDPSGAHELEIDIHGGRAARTVSASGIWDDDGYAVTTADRPDRVVPRSNGSARCEGTGVRVVLPPASWTVVEIAHGDPGADRVVEYKLAYGERDRMPSADSVLLRLAGADLDRHHVAEQLVLDTAAVRLAVAFASQITQFRDAVEEQQAFP